MQLTCLPCVPELPGRTGLAVDRGQMDDTGASTDSHGYAGRNLCVAARLCECTEAVAPVHATILLSLFPFSVFGRSVDVIYYFKQNGLWT